MGRDVLGTMRCPECGHDAAQVKEQKNGKPYRYCPECDAQYFARSDAAAAALLAKIGRAPKLADEQGAAPAAKPAAPAAPAAAPAAKRSGLSDALKILGGA